MTDSRDELRAALTAVENLPGATHGIVIDGDDVSAGMVDSDAVPGSVQSMGDWLQRGVVLHALRDALAASATDEGLWSDLKAENERLRQMYAEAVARPAVPALDDPLIVAALRFYADKMPAYAGAAMLTEDEFAAVMVDVYRARDLAALRPKEPTDAS